MLNEPGPGTAAPDAGDRGRTHAKDFRYLPADHPARDHAPDLRDLPLGQLRLAVAIAVRVRPLSVQYVLQRGLGHDVAFISARPVQAGARTASAPGDSAVVAHVVKLRARRYGSVNELPGDLVRPLIPPVKMQSPVPCTVLASLPRVAGVRAPGPVHAGLEPFHAADISSKKRVPVPQPAGVVHLAPLAAVTWLIAERAGLPLAGTTSPHKGDYTRLGLSAGSAARLPRNKKKGENPR